MDFILSLFDDPRDATATAILAIVIVLILTGRLIPWWTAKRELAAANKRADEHRAASEKKDAAIQALLVQNSTLLAGVRIADKFYRDFLPAIDEDTSPGVSHVGT